MVNHMVVSPMQNNFINRDEFNDFVVSVDRRFDEQKKYMNDGFEKVFEHIDNVEYSLGKRIDKIEVRLDAVEHRLDSLEKKFNVFEEKLDFLSTQIMLLTKVVNKIAERV